MSFAPATFRQRFPEFADPAVASDSLLESLAAEASLQMDAVAWGTWFDMGVNLFVAHNLALIQKQQRNQRAGQVPGGITGPLASKSVGEASASYDNSSLVIADGAEWNSTMYGIKWLRLSRLRGAGPLQGIC